MLKWVYKMKRFFSIQNSRSLKQFFQKYYQHLLIHPVTLRDYVIHKHFALLSFNFDKNISEGIINYFNIDLDEVMCELGEEDDLVQSLLDFEINGFTSAIDYHLGLIPNDHILKKFPETLGLILNDLNLAAQERFFFQDKRMKFKQLKMDSTVIAIMKNIINTYTLQIDFYRAKYLNIINEALSLEVNEYKFTTVVLNSTNLGGLNPTIALKDKNKDIELLFTINEQSEDEQVEKIHTHLI